MKYEQLAAIMVFSILTNITFSSFSDAQLKNENIIVVMPAGYKEGYRARQGQQQIVEMVLKSESVQDWSEMLTVNTTFGGISKTPSQYYSSTINAWKGACKGTSSQLIRQGKEKGYTFTFWIMVCPKSRLTGRPEWTLSKAIWGKDSFYLVSKAWSRKPLKKEIQKWSGFLSKVYVCDTRQKTSKCPF